MLDSVINNTSAVIFGAFIGFMLAWVRRSKPCPDCMWNGKHHS